jgi:hypothetical protein
LICKLNFIIFVLQNEQIMKLAILGSRTLTAETVKKQLQTEIEKLQPTELISGGSEGIGALLREIATEMSLNLNEIYPEWAKYGKQAAVIRNHEIIKTADKVLAIWDGKSKGTQHEIGLAQKYNKPLKIIAWQQKQESEQLSLL